jgi:hypothetical protein
MIDLHKHCLTSKYKITIEELAELARDLNLKISLNQSIKV